MNPISPALIAAVILLLSPLVGGFLLAYLYKNWLNGRSRETGNEKLLCPVCRAELKEDTVVGSIVRSCDTHGVWLDPQTVKHILKGR